MKEPLHRLQQENKAKLGHTISQHMYRPLCYMRNGILVRKIPMGSGALLLRTTEGEKSLTAKNVQISRQYLRIFVDFRNGGVAFRASFMAGGGGGSMREHGVDHVACASSSSSSSPFRTSVVVATTVKTTTQLRQFFCLV
jgi:hypothetical protein